MSIEEQIAARRAQLASTESAIAARRAQLSAPREPMPVPGNVLQREGPFPGYIDPELYRMGAIGRRFDQGIGAIPAEKGMPDVPLSLATGVVKGVQGAMDLPGQAFNAIGGAIIGGMERAGISSPEMAQAARDSLASGPFGSGETMAQGIDTVLPGARQYEPQTTAGQYAQTVGEFLPLAVATGSPIMGGVVPALASEAAGQATKGTSIEPYARVVAAVGAPTAINFGSKAFRSLFTASAKRPTVEGLRATKQAAYKAVDDAGEVFQPAEITRLRDRVVSALDDANYVPGVDAQTDAVLKVLDKRTTGTTTLGQLDKVRQNLWKRYNSAPNETGILDAIDEIDNLVASRAPTNELMQAARLANSRYKKAELLDIAFRKAADQTSSTGSGGNILNKYRQAITSIINNPKQAKWFAPEEIDAMRNFVRGSFSENALRRFGKLAPGGNGLMLALNLGATAVNPAMLGVTAAASGAKATADAMATSKAMNLMDMAAGVKPAVRPSPNYGPTLAPLASSVINQ